MSLCAQVHWDRRSAYEPVMPPYLRRYTVPLGRFRLLRIGQQAQPAEPVNPVAHLRALVVVAGYPQPGGGDQHVISAQPATTRIEPFGAVGVQHQVAGLWIKARETRCVETAAAEGIAAVRVAGVPLVPADVDGSAVGRGREERV